MARVRTTVSIDEQLLRAMRVRAARAGKSDSDVLEEALRRDLGFELLDRLWRKNDMEPDDAAALVKEALDEIRRHPRE